MHFSLRNTQTSPNKFSRALHFIKLPSEVCHLIIPPHKGGGGKFPDLSLTFPTLLSLSDLLHAISHCYNSHNQKEAAVLAS